MPDSPILEKRFNEGLDVDKYLKDGALLSRLFIEVQSNDKDAAETALKRVVFDGLSNEKSVKLIYAKLYDIRKDEELDFFSGVVEIKLLVMEFRWFVSVVMRYGPSAIELIEPNEVTLTMDEMQSLLADVSELTQAYSSKIMSLLKDDERKELYGKMLSSG